MLSQILDKITEELSEAINIIWNQDTLTKNLKKIKDNPEMGRIKERIDSAQEMLLELLTCVEQFEAKVALGFYMLE